MSDKLIRLHYLDKAPLIEKPEEFQYITVIKFDDSTVESFYKNFLKLNSDPEIKIIPIVISSYGGSVNNLMSMLDIMKTANKPVATIAMGKAMSCGAVLLAAGTKGFRFAGEHAEILIHEVSSAAVGKNSDIQNETKQTHKANKLLMSILAKSAGKKHDYFLNMSRKKANVDLYFTAKQGKKLGLIDHVGIPELYRTGV